MKYFLDTEFIEGKQSGWFGRKTKPTIDLISIGIVAEDGREYYAISKDFNLKEAWNRCDVKDMGIDGIRRIYWIRENVLKPIWSEYVDRVGEHDFPVLGFTYDNTKYLINRFGLTNNQIAKEVIEFCDDNKVTRSYHLQQSLANKPTNPNYRDIQFYTYYGAYDWVVFCWLFGKMIDLPKGFPMYSHDLKQMLNAKVATLPHEVFSKLECSTCKHDVLEYMKNSGQMTFDFKLKIIKEKHNNYPKQDNAHNALDDAKWNQKLYHFIKNL